MKKNNLCLITLIFGSFLFIHNSCRANTVLLIGQYQPSLTEIVPDDDVDPDWGKLITHLIGYIEGADSKV